jgi:5'-nucleotidase/UDP-sugar diphosphatase
MNTKIMMFSAIAILPTLITGQSPFTLKVLHMNDHHAHLGEDTLSIKTQTLPSEITVNINKTAVPEVKITYGGFPRLMTLLNGIEQNLTADALLKVHAGDVFSGTLFYTLFGGYADMQLMTPMCFDVMTLGNHDFDDGNANLETFLTNLTEATTNVCGSATKVVSANVLPPAGTKLASLLLPYAIKDYDGQEVAIIGLTTRDTANVASPDKGTQFLDEITALTATVTELEGWGINKIIAMTHVGYDVDMKAISSVKGVDVIIGAHSHTLLNKNLTDFIAENSSVPLNFQELGNILPVAGPYPTMSNDVCIVTAWCYAHVSIQ